MTYTIIIPKAVQKQLDALPDDVYEGTGLLTGDEFREALEV